MKNWNSLNLAFNLITAFRVETWNGSAGEILMAGQLKTLVYYFEQSFKFLVFHFLKAIMSLTR